MFIIETVINQELNVEKGARLIGFTQPDILFFTGLKITKQTSVKPHGHNPFADIIYYFRANVQYFIENSVIYITSAGGVMLDKRLVFTETEMDLTLSQFKQSVIDVNNSSAATGDMTKAIYDPTNVSGDAFDMDNMVEGANTKILTLAERNQIALSTVGGVYNNDADAAANSVPVGGLYVRSAATGFGGLIAQRLV